MKGGALYGEHMAGNWSLITLARNFGKETAILAGLDHSEGDYVLLMDADLQHTVEVALDMIGRIIADPDLDMVYAVRSDRAESRTLGRYLANGFYWLINMGQRYEIPANAGDFRVMTGRFATALRQLRDQRRFNKGLYAWTGFKQERILYKPAERQGGESKWSRRRLIAFSLEGFTSFSVVPLRMVSLFGTGVAMLGFLYGIKILLEVLFTGVAVPGYPSLIVAVLDSGRSQTWPSRASSANMSGLRSARRRTDPITSSNPSRAPMPRPVRSRARRARRPMADPGARSIWLIADDYGFSPGVSETIRTLLETGRLSGTGCMTLFDDWRDHARALAETDGRFVIGMHLTLTDFPALSTGRTMPDLKRLLTDHDVEAIGMESRCTACPLPRILRSRSRLHRRPPARSFPASRAAVACRAFCRSSDRKTPMAARCARLCGQRLLS